MDRKLRNPSKLNDNSSENEKDVTINSSEILPINALLAEDDNWRYLYRHSHPIKAEKYYN